MTRCVGCVSQDGKYRAWSIRLAGIDKLCAHFWAMEGLWQE